MPATLIKIAAKTPNSSIPNANGTGVPLYIWPTNAPIAAPNTICKTPWAEAAVPATSPNGSIAIAPKFGMIMLNEKNVTQDNPKKAHNGKALKYPNTNMMAEATTNAPNARVDINFIPYVLTHCELANPPKAETAPPAAKNAGNHKPTP